MANTARLPRIMTYTDLVEMPDDGQRYELVGGKLHVSPSPNRPHQKAEIRLSYVFYGHVTEHGLGEVYSAPFDVKLSDYDVVQPDLFFVSRARLSIVGMNFVEGAPDLVVEITSPSSRRLDLERKLELYASHGVREYWIVDLMNRTITVFTLVNGRYEILTAPGQPVMSKVLPDIVIDLNVLFTDL